MASTVADDGDQECGCSGCETRTNKTFLCRLGHRVWMCSNCHETRPHCPRQNNALGALCEAEELEYKTDKTDTDLDSCPDPSVLLDKPFAELHELHEKVASGKYDEVLSEVNRYKAYLQLVEGKALHARAGMTSGDEK